VHFKLKYNALMNFLHILIIAHEMDFELHTQKNYLLRVAVKFLSCGGKKTLRSN